MQQRIDAFVKLGSFLSQFSQSGIEKKEHIEFNDLFFDGFKHQIKIAQENNSWFTKDNVLFSLESWSKALTIENISTWLENQKFNSTNSRVAIIMAGNIPLVGFHDFLAVLISGHSVLVKQSSNDKNLLPFLAKYLEHIEPSIKGSIQFTEAKLESFDAIIATGSNNTSRYFEYYFKGKPNIIRKNRNSVAVITGNETDNEMSELSNDVFQYFGLGCRSVSKIFVPDGYNFDAFFNG
ncbi:MAG: acyl-CoA reductase, partial [Flavobacteriaceae bacterium]|nr:acyl-CoA reductase [Flavobacteriaceae bacterium]